MTTHLAAALPLLQSRVLTLPAQQTGLSLCEKAILPGTDRKGTLDVDAGRPGLAANLDSIRTSSNVKDVVGNTVDKLM
jgi:hypothetical protein